MLRRCVPGLPAGSSSCRSRRWISDSIAVEAIDQLADFVTGAALGAKIVAAVARHFAGDLREPEQRRRDDPLQPEGEREGNRKRPDQDQPDDAQELDRARTQLREIRFHEHHADVIPREHDRPGHGESVLDERVVGLRPAQDLGIDAKRTGRGMFIAIEAGEQLPSARKMAAATM